MSRRFGRNQRRRARENATALERMNETLAERASDLTLRITEADRLVARLDRENRQLVRTMQRVATILPPYHSALPPSARESEVFVPDRPERMAPCVRLPDFGLLSATAVSAEVMHVVEAYALIMGASKDPFGGAMHFRAEFDGELVGYRMTRQHIVSTPEKYLVQDIAQEMARFLVGKLRKAGR